MRSCLLEVNTFSWDDSESDDAAVLMVSSSASSSIARNGVGTGLTLGVSSISDAIDSFLWSFSSFFCFLCLDRLFEQSRFLPLPNPIVW